MGISAGMGVLGAIKGAKAREKQRLAIGAQEAKDNAWYDRNYYQNYMDSTMGRSAMKRVEDTLRRNNAANRAAAIVNGSTPEAALAQQEANNQALANAAENLAARGDSMRMQVDAMNQANQRNTQAQKMQQYQADETGAGQLMNNGFNVLGNVIGQADGIDNLFKKKQQEEV